MNITYLFVHLRCVIYNFEVCRMLAMRDVEASSGTYTCVSLILQIAAQYDG